jgi:hypothetical protein
MIGAGGSVGANILAAIVDKAISYFAPISNQELVENTNDSMSMLLAPLEIGGKAAAKSVNQMADDLSKELRVNRVKATTPSGEWRLDLNGKPHGGVPTPHVQEKTLRVGPNGRVNAKNSPARPATTGDVRTARKIVVQRNR